MTFLLLDAAALTRVFRGLLSEPLRASAAARQHRMEVVNCPQAWASHFTGTYLHVQTGVSLGRPHNPHS